MPSARLSGAQNIYKIKLRQLGYRLVYQVDDNIVTITVIAVGKRERNAVYRYIKLRCNDWMNREIGGEPRFPLMPSTKMHCTEYLHTLC
ncbi:type II toxin-antitoxin system RelE family toxin [Thiothrix winogradskyi]|uniref:type II toxin-antitoxin system RelE family toxin n=1 Tax=Thiothrix winogradskyi TaxID=96472 RepID=UPI00288355A5|nr:type II toxin-antitoxin system RelE/ParE family toxin [Thiothrix winogradskyi]